MKKIIIVVIALFVIIQFFTIDKTNPAIDEQKDFINITKPPTEVASMIKNACYDCHSNETKYPWYSNVAPVSWVLKNHITEGRRHVNFSLWADYENKKQSKKLDHIIEMINEGEMPMKPYALMHSEADLSDAQKKELVDWFTTEMDSL